MDFELLIAANFSWLSPASWWAMAQVLFGVGFVIFIHELGHFMVAKACGVKCEKFYVGFDFFDIKIGDTVLIPRALVKFQYGETEYGIGVIPLGGYVKMLGQDDNPSNFERENQRSRLEGAEGESAGKEVEASNEPRALDPRSYQAKSVLQRMCIISAGVVFNLISAVIMAAIAFSAGARYTPPTIGSTIIGGPAWKANLFGSRVLSINDKSAKDGYFPFTELIQETALNGPDKPIKLEILTVESSSPRQIDVVPQANLIPETSLALIGIQPELSSTIGGDADAINSDEAAGKATPPLQPFDQITKINGVELPSYELDGKKLIPIAAMRRILAELADQPITVTVVREGAEKEVTIPPNPAKTLGMSMRMAPVKAIQNFSPAAIAGLKAGDVIVSINDLPPLDALNIDLQMVRLLRAHTDTSNPLTVDVVVRRMTEKSPDENGELVTLVVSPRLPTEPSNPSSEPIAISTFGIAVFPTVFVEAVSAAGPAEQAGLKPGDRVTKLKLLVPPNVDKNSSVADWAENIKKANKTGGKSWMGIAMGLVQGCPAGTRYEISFERDGEPQQPVVLASQIAEEEFMPRRGFKPLPLESIYVAKSWTEAASLGARQTWSDAGRIGKTLGKLVSGQISPTNLGGPGTIAMIATMEASEGTSRLLLFLTMLSANLAIINFLPIPILDGGHMVFLAYEGIFRRPVTENVQIMLSWVGLVLILGLMVFVFSLDISRIFSLLR